MSRVSKILKISLIPRAPTISPILYQWRRQKPGSTFSEFQEDPGNLTISRVMSNLTPQRYFNAKIRLERNVKTVGFERWLSL